MTTWSRIYVPVLLPVHFQHAILWLMGDPEWVTPSCGASDHVPNRLFHNLQHLSISARDKLDRLHPFDALLLLSSRSQYSLNGNEYQ